MSAAPVDVYETRTPDAEGWRGVPFRHPRDLATAGDDGGSTTAGRCRRRLRATPPRRAVTARRCLTATVAD